VLESGQLSGYYGLRVRPGDERPVANDPKPTSRNAKILAAESVPLRTNLEPKPRALARLLGKAQVAKCPCDR
jgi:hypothetical protein